LLDIGGMVPVGGAVFDGVNATIYKIEGRNREALLALAAAIPGIGDAGKAAKWADEVGDAAKAGGRTEVVVDEQGKILSVKTFDENGNVISTHPVKGKAEIPPPGEIRRKENDFMDKLGHAPIGRRGPTRVEKRTAAAGFKAALKTWRNS